MLMTRWSADRVPTYRLIAAALAAVVTVTGSAGVATRAEAAPTADPILGAGKVSADFNGDGFGDLAVLASTTYDEVQDRDSFATVTIVYGSADGLATTERQRVTGRDMPDAGAQSFAFNPSAVVAGDLDGDGASELVLGWNSAATGSVPVAGAVYVIPGSRSGLRLGATQVWSQARAGVRGSPEIGDLFGSALAAADFGGGPEVDLAIGVPRERVGSKARYGQGMVQVLYGSPRGLTAAGDQAWSQDSPGVPGVAESEDAFGNSLAAGDFDGRHKADLAIGAPSEKVHTGYRAGAVTVLYSSATRLSTAGIQAWSQDSRGISGRAQREDFFGADLATGKITSSRRDDLAIAAPNEVSATHPDRGVVHLLPGSAKGLTASGSQVWTLPKLGGAADRTHHLGVDLLVADFGGGPGNGRYGDLLIGTRGDIDVNPPTSDYLLYGSPTGISRHDTVLSNNGFAAADFDTRGPSGFADLVTVGTDVDGAPVLDVYRGQGAGLDQQNSQRFTLTDLGLPDDPRGQLTLHPSAAGSR
ncbi:MAG TPA: FG-GAP repeat protein [Propionibacteriaceae bacterium]|nr:FG-GAP repeat protein [Propionibacteriaceae bacterium]